ncbi:hypothetical protein G9A89_007938 [Geosiphon pyriformis]|nr:hypothetical protein G9A89_007938 [Geosiphon pyriformis]
MMASNLLLLEVQPHPENVNSQQTAINNIKEKRPKTSVVTTPDTTTLEYYQSIYTHCKQRFNIPDGIEVVKKSVYQYIENCINNYLFGNYNISEVKSNLYNNLVHYSQLKTEDLNSKTLATYFQELNFNIIKYCEETYPVQFQYSVDFESETETSNKGKQKLKQYSKTTPNTPILPKTTVKHLQTPEQETSSKLPLTITSFPALLAQAQTPNSPLNQFARLKDFTSPRSPTRQQEPLQTSSNFLDFLAENQSEHSETAANKKNDSEISEEESIDSENEEDEITAYIAKIPEFNGENIETSSQEWFNQVTKAGDANGWNTAKMLRTILYFLKGTTAFKTAFLEQFTDNNTSITLQNRFRNIKQELSKSVMTYIGRFNKLLRQICQLKTNDYYSNAQILDQFIAGLKDKLIKKVRPYAPEDLNSAIQHAKRYKMAIEEANCTKLVNLAIGETNINHSKDEIKITLHHFLITSLRIAITVKSLATGKEIAESYNKTNKIGVINVTLHHSNLIINHHYQLTIYQDPNTQPIQQQYQQPLIQHYQVPAQRLITQNQFTPQNRYQINHYHTQPSYLTIPEKQNFHYTALLEGRAAAQQQNLSYTPTTIPPAKIAENANLSDIFLFKFEANESPFLLSNAAANKQKAITVMYTEAEVKRKSIRLILDSGSTGSIITYQLIQQLKKNVDQPAQTIIVTANGMKKIPVGKIDNFPFTINGITIPVKVLVMNAP